METWQIILLIISIIIVLYIILFVTNIVFIFSFKSILRKHNKSLSVILNTKYDNLKRLVLILEKHQVELDKDLVDKLNSLNPKDFAKQYTKECKEARDVLSQLRNNITYISTLYPNLEKHNEFQLAKDNVIELDDVYRINIAMYNADVLGYNYWIRFLPFRYVFLLFKLKKKDLIS